MAKRYIGTPSGNRPKPTSSRGRRTSTLTSMRSKRSSKKRKY